MNDTTNIENQIITLHFTVGEINGLLGVLGDVSFVKSAPFINSIHTQCMPQIEKINQKTEKRNEHKKRQ
jgi:hypothetical protein